MSQCARFLLRGHGLSTRRQFRPSQSSTASVFIWGFEQAYPFAQRCNPNYKSFHLKTSFQLGYAFARPRHTVHSISHQSKRRSIRIPLQIASFPRLSSTNSKALPSSSSKVLDANSKGDSADCEKPSSGYQRSRWLSISVRSGAVVFSVFLFLYFAVSQADAEETHLSLWLPVSVGPEQAKAKVKLFSISEIRQHGAESDNPWVIKGTGVYDITKWIAAHPGGNVILRAAGSSIEPFWNIFTIHKSQDVYDILEQYRIGDVDPRDLRDGKLPQDAIEDPFKDDPVRDPRLIVLTQRPCNAETPKSELSEFVTPTETFYVRNHLWVPQIAETSHKIAIDLGDGEDEKEYSISDLKTNFKQYKVTAVLQCSGNRRSHMGESGRKASGLPWDVGAIGNAEWSGPKLRDVLLDAGFSVDDPPENMEHVQFISEDAYGASIPIRKALDKYGDVLLAIEMNGQPLSPDHGFPIRTLVPGHVAARSVKWLNRIVISEEESTSQWQRKDYKCFGPNIKQSEANWDDPPAIQEMPVQSAITSLQRSENSGPFSLAGYAFSGGGRKIVRVDISVDDGKTWDQAELEQDKSLGSKKWSWTRWNFEVNREKVGGHVLVKAVDEAYNSQPESQAATWNFRGNLPSAWHRLAVDRD